MRLTSGLVALLAFPAAATAAPLNELPFQPLPERQAAGCLRPTGEGLALFGEPSATDLWRVDGTGAARGERVGLGRLATCASVAEAGGSAVVASVVARGRRFEVRSAVRDAGGAFGPPTRLGGGAYSVATAVTPAGHGAVAWIAFRGGFGKQRFRVMVARRLPGQPFGAPEPLSGWWRGEIGETRPAVAVDAAGTTTVVWSQPVSRFRARVMAAVAPAGSPFAAQRLRTYDALLPVNPGLAVAADGWSVLAHDLDGAGMAVYERAPGAARFSRVGLPPTDPFEHPWDATAAVAAGGAAVVAWRTELIGGGVTAVTRAGAGAFGPPHEVSPSRRESVDGAFGVVVAAGEPPFDNEGSRLRAALGPGGRVLLAWTAAGRRGALARTRAATGVLGGAFDAAQTLSTPIRHAEAPAPLFLADGRAGVAWIDNAEDERDGRLHVAVEGAPALASRPPRLRVGAPRVQRLYRSAPLRVTASCDGPCDVEARVRGAGRVSATLPRGGRRTLALTRSRRPGRLRIEVRASEPGGRAIACRSLRVRVLERRPLPLLRPLGVSARRRGDRIVVRWHTERPARRMYFTLHGTRTRDPADLVGGAQSFQYGRGQSRFVAHLRGRARWVRVIASSFDLERTKSVTVPVR